MLEHRFHEKRARKQSINKRNGGHGNKVSVRLIRVDIGCLPLDGCIFFVRRYHIGADYLAFDLNAPPHTPHNYLPNLTLSVGMDLDS